MLKNRSLFVEKKIKKMLLKKVKSNFLLVFLLYSEFCYFRVHKMGAFKVILDSIYISFNDKDCLEP